MLSCYTYYCCVSIISTTITITITIISGYDMSYHVIAPPVDSISWLVAGSTSSSSRYYYALIHIRY